MEEQWISKKVGFYWEDKNNKIFDTKSYKMDLVPKYKDQFNDLIYLIKRG